MPDIFDQIAGNVETPIAAPQGDFFDQIAGVTTGASSVAPSAYPEVRGVLNEGLQGVGGFLGLVDQLNPIRPGDTATGLRIGIPPLFGLGYNQKESGELPFTQVFSNVTKDTGIATEDKPQTQIGKLLGNVLENAAGAAPFGPAAMVGNAVFGGVGGYLGEAALGPQGRAWGSLAGGLSPAGLSKLGIVKEIGEQLGPTITQLPGLSSLFGDTAVKAAAGRALNKVSSDPAALEGALQTAVQAPRPLTQLDSLKTTAELTRDAGIASAEDAIQNMLPNAPFKALATERAGARASNVMKDYQPTVSNYETSKALEGAIGESAQAIKKVEDIAWKALPMDAAVNTKLPGLQENLATAIDDITFSGALPLEGEAKGLVKSFENATSEGNISFAVVQKLRSKALEVQRATGKGLNAADRTANQVASTIEEHLRNIVDANAEAGLLTPEAKTLWENARSITSGKRTIFGAANEGTKGLEQVGLRGQSLDNTALLREGLNSPDKLVSHLQAAAAGGQDVRPLYQQALKAELDGAPQSQWANIIDRKRPQWEMIFSKEEIANLDKNLADVEQELAKNRLRSTTNSATNSRGNVQNILNSEKGIAALGVGAQNAGTLLAAGAGAKHGWDKSNTTIGGIGNALLYGSIGAVLGKAGKSALSSTSNKYESILTAALKDPAAALEAVQAAKPSKLGEAFQSAAMGAAKGTAAKGGGTLLNSVMGNLFSQSKTGDQKPQADPIASALDTAQSSIEKLPAVTEEPMQSEEFNAKVDKIASDLGADPQHLLAVMNFETGGTLDPAQKNKAGSGATGLIQFMPSTAKELTGKDTEAAAIKALSKMTPLEQLDYVQKYLQPFKGKLNTLEDLYMAVLWPKAVGKDGGYELFKEGTKRYWQNRGLDLNEDGVITKAEAASKVGMA